MSSSLAPSNTGVANGTPCRSFFALSISSLFLSLENLSLKISFPYTFSKRVLRSSIDLDFFSHSIAFSKNFFPKSTDAAPKWVSNICPTFILDGTPKGFKTISTGVPSSMYGISSTGIILDITPLLPCLPAILSPGASCLFTATKTLTNFITPGKSSSPDWTLSTFIWNVLFNKSRLLSNASLSISIFFIMPSSETEILFKSLSEISESKLSDNLSFFLSLIFPFWNFWFKRSDFRFSLKLFSRINRSSSMSMWSCSICILSFERDLSSLSTPLLEKTLTSTIVPDTPGGSLNDVSFTSAAFSPKIALRSFSSGVIGDSPLGVTFPTRMSPGLTFAPIWTIPASSRLTNDSSPTFGISLVISSCPNFVSRARTSNSWIWI